MSHFAKGDPVAWSHVVATEHGKGSVARKSVVTSRDPDAEFGVVQKWNPDTNGYDIKLGNETKSLGFEELVRYEDG
jgi:hypothetical protein